MRCPNCGLVNPEAAERCDCGYDFVSALLKAADPAKAAAPPAEPAPWALETIGALLLGIDSCQAGVTYSSMPISAGALSAVILAPAVIGVIVLVAARYLPGGRSRRARARLFAGTMLLLFLGNCGIWSGTRPPEGTMGDVKLRAAPAGN